MRKTNTTLPFWLMIAIACGCFLIVDSADAQRGGRNVLQVCEQLPDITVFDESGEPFKLESLKGKYSVIVFGCLT